MTPAEVLLKAADIIHERGWNQHGFVAEGSDTMSEAERATCPVDVLGAIAIAATARNLERDCDFISVLASTKGRPAVLAFAEHLGLHSEGRAHGYVTALGEEWNDGVATSGDQVMAVLRDAAAGLS